MRAATLLIVVAFLAGGCGSAQHVTITATPRSSLVDQTVAIRVAGAKPGSLLSLQLAQGGWGSRGVYRVAPDGTVDVPRATSVAGTYKGRAAMGLFWSMVPPVAGTDSSPFTGGPMRLTASVAGKRLASTTLIRRFAAPDVTHRAETLAHEGFDGVYFAPPRTKDRRTPVLVFGGSEGGLASTYLAAELASHGYPALAIGYFDLPGLPKGLVRVPLEYFARAARWLDRQPGVDANRLVADGTSRGSEAALELGIHYPALVHGVIGGATGAYVLPGLPERYTPGKVPAWTLHGKPLPAAEIAVERIKGPVLVTGGGDDELWTSYSNAPELARRSKARHGPPVTALVYPHAGHDIGVALPNLPWQTTLPSHGYLEQLGGTPAADQAALVNLWPRLLHFLSVVPGR